MGVLRNVGGFISNKVFKPVEKAVIRPVKKVVVDPVAEHVIEPVVDHVVAPVAGAVGDHVVEPIAENVVNPVREKVDYKFAIRDEMAAYEQALAHFRDAYAIYAEDWSNYVTARIEHERLSEEFEPDFRNLVRSGQSFQPVPERLKEDRTFLEFFEPKSLLDLVTGQKFATYFKSIKNDQVELERQTKRVAEARNHVQNMSRSARKQTAALQARSQQLRNEFGKGGSVSQQLLKDTKRDAQIDMVQRLSQQGLDAEAISDMTGWSAAFVNDALERAPKFQED